MENIFTNSGLIDIREQIFGYLDQRTLKNCREVFAKEFGEEWESWLERFILIQFILDFGDKKVKYKTLGFPESHEEAMIKDLVPGWKKAVQKFGIAASLMDLDEVKRSLKRLFIEEKIMERCGAFPLHSVAEHGHLKLMEFLLYTDSDINEEIDGYTPFIEACRKGHIEIVNLLINSSKKYGIDLNYCGSYYHSLTGFMHACFSGHVDIVKLMITSSEKFGIDLNARSKDWEDKGQTGFMWACNMGRTNVVKLMINLSQGYDIGNVQRHFILRQFCALGHRLKIP